jgi:hypothetical protein
MNDNCIADIGNHCECEKCQQWEADSMREARAEYDASKGKFDLAKIDNIVCANVNMRDYPDFCNAYIESADYNGIPMTESQLERLNDTESDFCYEKISQSIY